MMDSSISLSRRLGFYSIKVTYAKPAVNTKAKATSCEVAFVRLLDSAEFAVGLSGGIYPS